MTPSLLITIRGKIIPHLPLSINYLSYLRLTSRMGWTGSS